MEEELKYSDNALLNMDLFFNNEINFYIEDEGKEYRYAEIFRELFNFKIESIFALGGKNNLKHKYYELNNTNQLTKCFFIADLDFDYILEKEMLNNDHFIYLERYEIENYIIDKNAIIIFLENEMCCMGSKVDRILNYEEWILNICKDLYELFILYLIVQNNQLSIENVNKNANEYFDDNGKVISSKIELYYKKVEEELSKKRIDIQQEIKNMKDKVKEKYKGDFQKLIKGKYILTGLRKYLCAIVRGETQRRYSIKEKTLIDYLFLLFDKNSLKFIKDRVETCIRKEMALNNK